MSEARDKTRLQIMTVRRVDQSPMNAKRWCLTLNCGHEVWVTASRRPSRMKQECTICPRVRIYE
jgi:hypothetical protein